MSEGRPRASLIVKDQQPLKLTEPKLKKVKKSKVRHQSPKKSKRK